MKRGRMLITGDLLIEALRIPEDTRLVDMHYLPDKDLIECLFDHAELPESDKVPLVKVYYRKLGPECVFDHWEIRDE
jgi:hypothetical protein